jgi:hypothetical protein
MGFITDIFRKVFVGESKPAPAPEAVAPTPAPAPVVVEPTPAPAPEAKKEEVKAEVERVVNNTAKKPAAKKTAAPKAPKAAKTAKKIK